MSNQNIGLTQDLRTAFCIVCNASVPMGLKQPFTIAQFDAAWELNVKEFAEAHRGCHLGKKAEVPNG